MSELIWRLDDLNYPDPDRRPEELPFIDSYDLFRNSLAPGAWQIVEVWDEGIVLYANIRREFHGVPLDFIKRLYNEPMPSGSNTGGNGQRIFEGFVAGPDLRIAFDKARAAFQNRRDHT